MTEAGWTREKPTVAGWYWYKPVSGYDYAEVLLVLGDEGQDCPLFAMQNGVDVKLSRLDGEWLGPITPDSYQQGRVAGLTKAVEIIKANTDVKKAIEIIRLHALAQQAQDEKGVGDGRDSINHIND